jgi:hypothetical protein
MCNGIHGREGAYRYGSFRDGDFIYRSRARPQTKMRLLPFPEKTGAKALCLFMLRGTAEAVPRSFYILGPRLRLDAQLVASCQSCACTIPSPVRGARK